MGNACQGRKTLSSYPHFSCHCLRQIERRDFCVTRVSTSLDSNLFPNHTKASTSCFSLPNPYHVYTFVVSILSPKSSLFRDEFRRATHGKAFDMAKRRLACAHPLAFFQGVDGGERNAVLVIDKLRGRTREAEKIGGTIRIMIITVVRAN